MELLQKRPLALFCVCFLAAIYVAVYVPDSAKPICLAVASVIAVGFLLLALLQSRRRIACIALFLCTLSVGFAFLHTYMRLDLREREALSHTGKRTVECQILSVEYQNEYRTECEAVLLQIGEEHTKIRTYLICGFSADLHAGDRILARVELTEIGESAYGVCAAERVNDSRILVSTVWHDAERGTLLSCGEEKAVGELLREPNRVELLSDRMRAATAGFFDRSLGREISPLARSFFIGDKSDLSPRTVRDFRRTGTSHLLAVSGLHVAVLLGGLEWILRKLTLPKLARILAISIAGLGLLALTGFSMSACRSVLMLYSVYLHYLFAKENDALTSLLVSVSLILVLSPDAFFDLGLWMSFFATLGLVTVYPLLNAHIPQALFSSRPLRVLWQIVRAAIMTALMSLVTTLFLLPIYASVFGEISLVTVPANILLAPLGVLYLYVIPFAVLLAPIPLLGQTARLLLGTLGDALRAVLAFFSGQNGAVLSLRYRFVNVIVPLLILCMLVLLLIRLRYKWILFVPPMVAVLCFVVCLFATYFAEAPVVTDYTNGDARMLCMSDDGESAMLDLSCTETGAYFEGAEALRRQGATDVDVLVLGHLSREHPTMLEEFLPYTVVHRICLSRELAEQNFAIAYEIGRIAEAAGSEVLLYDDGTPVALFRDASAILALDTANTKIAGASLLCGESRVTYADFTRLSLEARGRWQSAIGESHTAFLDADWCDGDSVQTLSPSQSSLRQIVFRHSHDHKCIVTDEEETVCYFYPRDRKKRVISFSLEP